MTKTVLATRQFTTADQTAFADFSGDRNPMHLDPISARRTQAGDVVIHGVHGLLWALEVLAAKGHLVHPVTGIQASFRRFIYLNQEAELHLVEVTPVKITAELSCSGSTASVITVKFAGPPTTNEPILVGGPETIISEHPLEPDPTALDGLQGWLRLSSGGLAMDLFPACSQYLGERRVEVLARLSTVVGMVCPGLHSIFSSLSVDVLEDEPGGSKLAWKAMVPDPRYARVVVAASGPGLQGELKTLVRPAPVKSVNARDIASRVMPDEFADRRVVVIGGSRGIGAVTAKLLAAGGAEVAITYLVGKADAELVVADIRGEKGKARALQFDVLGDFEPLEDVLKNSTHIYYFATQPITRQAAQVYSPATFQAFNRIYVDGFYAMAMAADPSNRDLSILFPSSVYVAERPRGMTEYAMSKAAGEQLCQDLMRAYPRLSITAPRLPRILTDQTALAIPIKAEAADAVMLPLLRTERTHTTPSE